MSTLLSRQNIKTKLKKQWQQLKFHKAFLQSQINGKEDLFPFEVKLNKPTDKQFLHQYPDVKAWLDEIQTYDDISYLELTRQQVNYHKMGKQRLPVGIIFNDIEGLARYLGSWQQWQKFVNNVALIKQQTLLCDWLANNALAVEKHADNWVKLLAVVSYFIQQPKPNCYIRQLDIGSVDTKFIEQHKSIIKTLLDQVLPNAGINTEYEKLSEHGFEKRFGLLYEQPQVRFRLLDQQLIDEFNGVSDLVIPLNQFAQLNLLLDRVFITENKINGLAFPQINNSIVIFGLGYGIQTLKKISWLNECQIYYWGDIDTHGFAMLSQVRSYFSRTQSILMDEATLLLHKQHWGEEQQPVAAYLANLSKTESQLYQNLKEDRWQANLRLEQEKIHFKYLTKTLKQLSYCK